MCTLTRLKICFWEQGHCAPFYWTQRKRVFKPCFLVPVVIFLTEASFLVNILKTLAEFVWKDHGISWNVNPGKLQKSHAPKLLLLDLLLLCDCFWHLDSVVKWVCGSKYFMLQRRIKGVIWDDNAPSKQWKMKGTNPKTPEDEVTRSPQRYLITSPKTLTDQWINLPT